MTPLFLSYSVKYYDLFPISINSWGEIIEKEKHNSRKKDNLLSKYKPMNLTSLTTGR